MESSQTRVEGANFDVRKHLLEYDDVLNSQRERIYEQRDRIFDKEDLREDVVEMLRTEVSRRVTQGLADEEGPWKLLAYLEDTQPPIQHNTISYPSYTLKLMMDQIGHPATTAELKSNLLDLADVSLRAWHEHLRNWAMDLIQRSEMGYESQFAERTDALDTFVEGLGYDESGQQRDINSELSNLVRIPLRLSQETLTGLEEGAGEAIDEVRRQVRNALMLVFLRRLILTFERRFNDSWNLKPSELVSDDWEEISKNLLARVEDTLNRREEHFLGENGEIAHDLDVNNDLLENALTDSGALMRLLIMMTQGRVITFDQQSHKRQMKATIRLTYIFRAAQELEDKPVEEVQQDILTHLEAAQDKLSEIWGQTELDRLYNAGQVLNNISPNWQERLQTAIGADALSGSKINRWINCHRKITKR